MDPFGNFGWSFGFGFGWILIPVFVALMAAAIAQLTRPGFRDKDRNRETRAELDSLEHQLCEHKINPKEFEEKIHALV